MIRLAGIVMTLLASCSVAAAEPTLESKLLPLIDGHKGDVAVAVKHLGTGETWLYHADVPMPTASLIKFPVMIEAYRQAEEGKIDLTKMVTLTKEDKVPGSGVLTTHFSDGTTLSVRDAVRLMITYSDNTATNLVVDQIGLKSTADTMEKLGYPHTKLHSKVFRRDTSIFPDRSKEFGLGSSSANEMIKLCESLHKKELVSVKASEAMIEHMKMCDDPDKFPRFLPPGIKLAFKTGSVNESRTAAGIIYDPAAGPFVLCVMTNKNGDQRWSPENAGNRLCANIARECFDYFRAKAATAGVTAKTTAAQ